MSADKWELPDRYEANGYHYRKVEQLPCRWGIFSQACRPDGKIVGYELVRPSPDGTFPPPDDRWGRDGFTFTWETHKDPLASAKERFLSDCVPIAISRKYRALAVS